ncbi:hypothetical protein [Nocardia amikacinitolerans]|nr:hypothetical protein [Nocardia amikacinitolerans]
MNYAEAALWYTVFRFGVPFVVIGLLIAGRLPTCRAPSRGGE